MAARICRVPPRRRFEICCAASGKPFSRPSGALQMCRLWRRGSPGPAPAGGLTSCAPKKSAEEGRSRGLPPVPLRNPREYLAITRRLPSLPTGTPAEGSIQVAGTPNNGCQKARRGLAAENNARSGRSRALRACAASPRSFPPPRGRCAPRKSGRVSPNALSVRFRRLAGRGIAPAARRLAGCCTPVR